MMMICSSLLHISAIALRCAIDKRKPSCSISIHTRSRRRRSRQHGQRRRRRRNRRRRVHNCCGCCGSSGSRALQTEQMSISFRCLCWCDDDARISSIHHRNNNMRSIIIILLLEISSKWFTLIIPRCGCTRKDVSCGWNGRCLHQCTDSFLQVAAAWDERRWRTTSTSYSSHGYDRHQQRIGTVATATHNMDRNGRGRER